VRVFTIELINKTKTIQERFGRIGDIDRIEKG
jgi:hypothetical protein